MSARALPLTEPTHEALTDAMRGVMDATTVDRIVATSPDGVLLGETLRVGANYGYSREFGPALYGLARGAADALDWGAVSMVLVDIAVVVGEKPVPARTLVATTDPEQPAGPIFLVSAPRSADDAKDFDCVAWAAGILPHTPAATTAAHELAQPQRLGDSPPSTAGAPTAPADLPLRPRPTQP